MSDDILKRIVNLATQQVALEAKVAQTEETLKIAKADLEKICRGILPDLMLEAGLLDLTLPDGRKVSLREDFYAKIPDEQRGAAFLWLKERGYDGIIKTKVAVEFGRGEAAGAQTLAEELFSKGLMAIVDEGVHHSTLKSFLRERLEAKEQVPFDLFGISQFNQTKIK